MGHRLNKPARRRIHRDVQSVVCERYAGAVWVCASAGCMLCGGDDDDDEHFDDDDDEHENDCSVSLSMQLQ